MGDGLSIRQSLGTLQELVAGLRGRRLANADQLQDRRVASTAPGGNDFLAWDSTNKAWRPVTFFKSVRKTSDETVNSSTTLQDDDDLVIAIGASETWTFECMIAFNAHATPDIKFGWTVPSGATLRWGLAKHVGAESTTNLPSHALGSGGSELNISGEASARITHIMGIIVNSTTAGNLQLQWAQVTSDANDTTVLTNSWLKGHQIL